MKEQLKYNKYNYFKEERFNLLNYFIFLIFLIFIIFISTYKIDIIEEITATTTCSNNNCTISFYNLTTRELKEEEWTIKDKTYKVEEYKYGEVMLDTNNNSLNLVTIKLKDYKGSNNEIVTLKGIKNREILVVKLFKIILERT